MKRTIRDYFSDYKGQEIFIKEIRDDKGNIKTKEARLNEFKDNEELLKECIDVRLFGATTAVKGKTMTLTGPVQFKYGRSLHRVDISYIKGTTVMPSKEDRKQGTFTEKYILPYSLISFYGIINENAAKRQEIGLTDGDIEMLMDGIWNGTKNLMSTSKMGQMPRLLLQIIYKEDNFHIGELDKRIKFVSGQNDEEIRDIKDGKLDITELLTILKINEELIQEIRYKVDERAIFSLEQEEIMLIEALNGFNTKMLSF